MVLAVRASAAPVRAARTTVRAQAALTAPQRIAQAFIVGAASLAVASSSYADVTIKLGADGGGLVFDPSSVTVKAGEKITFVNNAGFPHNIVFDEDEIPAGVSADAISREDYLNAPGETYSLKLDKAGSYGYYCEPHQGAGMKGTITVQ